MEEYAINVALAIITLFLGGAGSLAIRLGIRWLSRLEKRIDEQDKRDWGFLEHTATKEDVQKVEARIDLLEGRLREDHQSLSRSVDGLRAEIAAVRQGGE